MTSETTGFEEDDPPDIPPPTNHIILKRCPWPKCNQGWFTEIGYRGHYALVHVCKLPERGSP